jgi:predicted secreted hydrolase
VRRRATGLALAVAVIAALTGSLAACGGQPILANAPIVLPVPPRPTPRPSLPPDPQPIVFPRDDGPHDRLTEWWYYTGHLASQDGGRFGFEAVIFRAERGDVPVTWASHLALTDEVAGTFTYAQRAAIGPQVSRPVFPFTRNLGLAAGDGSPDWSMVGTERIDELLFALSPAEAATAGRSFGLALGLSTTRSPVLHEVDGWIPFGPAGGSYYYSRTRMDAGGHLTLDGRRVDVTGTAWFDHQWGDFISVGGGGWDWFAVNLDNGMDLTISLVRAADGSYPLVYGTLVDAGGSVNHLDAAAFSVAATGSWTSPQTGATYPAGWRIEVPARQIVIELTPTVSDQELDTRATTGVVYWEGSQRVVATVGGVPVAGQAYVELTGYAP